MTELRFYFDENVDIEVAAQLLRHGIEAITVRDLEKRGDTDENHLERATRMEYVLCTHDQDFLRMAAAGISHAGIAFAEHERATIGGWVKALRKLYDQETMESMIGTIQFLNVR